MSWVNKGLSQGSLDEEPLKFSRTELGLVVVVKLGSVGTLAGAVDLV